MNNKELKRKEFLFEIINDVINGMDVYNHNGSLWLIKTEDSKWAIEFTKDKTLWYNYNLFKNLFKAISLDVSENQKYVTEWFESRFLNMQKVKDSCEPFFDQDQYVEDTIQNGVKDTKRTRLIKLAADQMVEDTIQNGVKHTWGTDIVVGDRVEDTIQNGVKDTCPVQKVTLTEVEDVIQNGVKDTHQHANGSLFWVEDVIQNGVKQTELSKRDFFPKDIIQDGVKINGTYVGGKRQKENVEVVIDYGVKETYDDCSDNISRVEGIIIIGEKIS